MGKKSHTQENQSTLNNTVRFLGKGIHTGRDVSLTVLPEKENHGIVFQRMDLASRPKISAHIDNVVATNRATTIAQNGVQVGTIEHLMSAFSGCGVDNALVQIDGEEVPIMDGSAKAFTEEIQKVGLKTLQAKRKYVKVHQPIIYSDESTGAFIKLFPNDTLSLHVIFRWEKENRLQHAMLQSIEDYEEEIASNRTFCFLSEIEVLMEKNLILGADTNSALVMMDKTLNEPIAERIAHYYHIDELSATNEGLLMGQSYRFENEPSRHKLLDVIGDLFLLNCRIKAHVQAYIPSHKLNIEMARMLQKKYLHKKDTFHPIEHYQPSRPPLLDIKSIMKIIPHRYPFLLLDAVYYIDTEYVVAAKHVSYSDIYLQGHFPSNPIMPGVLQIEIMAQAGAALVLNGIKDSSLYWIYFLGIEKVRFRKQVFPGDTIVVYCSLKDKIRRGLIIMEGECYADNKLMCRGDFKAALIEKKTNKASTHAITPMEANISS